MRAFFTLFKYERRALFPFSRGGKRSDFLGALLSLVGSLLIVAVFLALVYAVADSYVTIKIDKVSDPVARSRELLNALYTLAILSLAVMCLEKMRASLATGLGREIFLKIPVTHTTLFMSKLAALMLWNYWAALLLVVPINLVFYFVLKAGVDFLLHTLLVWLLLPTVSFLLATVLLVPYIKLVDFLSSRYFITFLLFSALLIGAFYVYSELLDILRGLFETGSIKFLFSASFVEFLSKLLLYTYPANALSSIALGIELYDSLYAAISVAMVGLLLAFLVTSGLYRLTLYKSSLRKIRRGKRHLPVRSPLLSLINKEFITVFRRPGYMFSYFAIAIAMPFMAYCSYTLFRTLLLGALGLSFDLSLALIVILIFSILTNTFCATNITRDGPAGLKTKIYPLRARKLLSAKVLFCNIISSLSVVAAALVLHLFADLTLRDAAITGGIGLLFSLSQILIATRMDLNHATVTLSHIEIARASNRTMAKTIAIGFFFALLIGFLSLFISIFAGTATPEFLKGIEVKESYIYTVPLAIALVYLAISWLYYAIRLNTAFQRFVK